MAVAFARVLRGASLRRADRQRADVRRGARPRRHRRARRSVYWAARATLVHQPEDIAAVRPGVRRVLGRTPRPALLDEDPETIKITLATDDDDDGDDDDDDAAARAERRPDADAAVLVGRGAAQQGLRRLRRRPNSQLAQQLMSRLRFVGPPRRSFRYRTVAPRRPPRPAAPRCAARCAPAASRSAATGASPATACAGWCCCSTSAARWSPTPGRCCGSCTPPSPAANGRGVRARHPPDPRHQGAEQPRSRHAPCGGQRAGARLERRHPAGRCLRRFNDEWGVRGMARGAIVVDPHRRLGPRRPDGARRADAAGCSASPTT